jgi:uncharacterized protein (DUF2384 family)
MDIEAISQTTAQLDRLAAVRTGESERTGLTGPEVDAILGPDRERWAERQERFAEIVRDLWHAGDETPDYLLSVLRQPIGSLGDRSMIDVIASERDGLDTVARMTRGVLH